VCVCVCVCVCGGVCVCVCVCVHNKRGRGRAKMCFTFRSKIFCWMLNFFLLLNKYVNIGGVSMGGMNVCTHVMRGEGEETIPLLIFSSEIFR
jgi:hypothetical protein